MWIVWFRVWYGIYFIIWYFEVKCHGMVYAVKDMHSATVHGSVKLMIIFTVKNPVIYEPTVIGHQ